MRLRCTVYYRNRTVVSRLIHAALTPVPQARRAALSSVVEYVQFDPADRASLAESPGYAASLALARDSTASHTLSIVAGTGSDFYAELPLREGDIASQIHTARGALSMVAWGSRSPWDRTNPAHRDRFATRPKPEKLSASLQSLAVTGYRLYYTLIRQIARADGSRTYDMADRLTAYLAHPARIEIVLRRRAQHVLPAALMYDYPLDTGAQQLTTCGDFLEAYANGTVAQAPCFLHQCAQARARDDTVVCPGGFWGYRHALGLPVSVGTQPPLPSELPVLQKVLLSAGMYWDFASAATHHQTLEALDPRVSYYAPPGGRQDVIRMLQYRSQPNVVYFYCHGGLTAGGVPFLKIGREADRGLTPDAVLNFRFAWPDTRPLVFLNGCQTTDLAPERVMDFVSALGDAGACGVIGSEITCFEGAASRFAESFLRSFVCDRLPVGEALTSARIALLGTGNPLGLAYTSFTVPHIRLGVPT